MLEIAAGTGIDLMGIVVDSVSEVLNIKGEDIDNTPNLGTKLKTECILGMAKMEERVKILLNIDKVLMTQEVMDYCWAAARVDRVQGPVESKRVAK